MLDMMGYKQTRATPIAQDNNACIFLVKGAGMYARARHIDTRVYRIRELATGRTPEVSLYKIAGGDQPSDLFTKGLPRPAFEKHRATLMGEVPLGYDMAKLPTHTARGNVDGRVAVGTTVDKDGHFATTG